ncbi:MAG: DUF2336 domain-containing protein [Kiloniellales bacterium]|nr:DUF2336 domain-containing protein [Kiloniellales bacterium]
MADVGQRHHATPKRSPGEADAGMERQPTGMPRDPFDVAPLLRRSFVRHLKNVPYLPPGLAQTLARDVETVALDTVRIDEPKGAGGTAHRNVGPNGQGSVDPMLSPMDGVAESVYALSCLLRDLLIVRHSLPQELADRITQHGREGTLIEAAKQDPSGENLKGVVTYLADHDGLTASLLLRSLCLGQMDLFEIAVANRAGIGVDEARRKIRDPDRVPFSELYEQAGLPPGLYRAFRAAVKVHRRVNGTKDGKWQPNDTNQVIESLVKEYEYLGPEDLEHVLSQLAREAFPTA